MTALGFVESSWLLDALARYWPLGPGPVAALALRSPPWPAREPLPPALTMVALPEWAASIGVDGALLVPAHRVAPGIEEPWRRTDWLGAAFWYLAGVAEREPERVRGPIHSYAFRLRGWDTRLWDHAWVNRIALFLRRWAAREHGVDERALLGPLPPPETVLTHDIDALFKTMAIRIKRGAFLAFQAMRAVRRGRLARSAELAAGAVRFVLAAGDYDRWPALLATARAAGLSPWVFVAGGRGGWRRNPVALLFDPAYGADARQSRELLALLRNEGWPIGLHPSFSSWDSPADLGDEKARLESAAGGPVSACRQHWLRFSWRDTWAAQQKAGLQVDATLGFNDRPGFRCGAALRFRPWDGRRGAAMDIEALPLVLMDSHLYDYADLDAEQRERAIAAMVEEVRAVGGTASFLWHPHTLSPDFGWEAGFHALLRALAGARA